MSKTNIHIIVTYIFHLIYIILSIRLMKQYSDDLLLSVLVGGALYLTYWIICSLKQYMPWKVYIHFVIGAFIQVMLNLLQIVPEDDGFLSGLGQAVYILVLVAFTAVIGIINWVIYAIHKKRREK